MNVLPTLAVAIEHEGLSEHLGDVENDVLTASHRLNTLTHQRICAEAARVSAALRGADLAFAFSKGTARLLMDQPIAIGRRVTGDLDLRVDPTAVDMACGILVTVMGYELIVVEPAMSHAWGYLVDPTGVVTLDLHLRPGPQHDVLATEEALGERVWITLN